MFEVKIGILTLIILLAIVFILGSSVTIDVESLIKPDTESTSTLKTTSNTTVVSQYTGKVLSIGNGLGGGIVIRIEQVSPRTGCVFQVTYSIDLGESVIRVSVDDELVPGTVIFDLA